MDMYGRIIDESKFDIIHLPEFNVTHLPMFQKVVDMFEDRPHFQRIVKRGILANMGYIDELDVSGEDDYEDWVHGRTNSRGSPGLSGRSYDGGLSENLTASSSSPCRLLRYHAAASDHTRSPSVKVQIKESDSERRARLLQEEKKGKEKVEKKRLKKQKQKERRLLEKLKNEKENPVKNEEEKDDAGQSKEGERGKVHGTSNSSVEELVSKDTDSSDSSEDEHSDEDNDSGNSEELDMTSTFVSKAAVIAKRKLEQKAKFERKEKTRTPEKEAKTIPGELNEDPDVEKKDSTAPSFEDNVKISTDLASIGNKFASAGDFNMAVKYFTDAIKYNPTEFKLFGNRSYCFEKMQEYMKALTDAELSLTMCPGWVKGLFRKGRALAGLKRYGEAAQAFRDVLQLDSSCAEAAQELMRVQITQLMEHGFSREQSSNALIIHGTVKKAVEVLSKLNNQPAIPNGTLPLAQVANASGVSPVLSANIKPALAQSHDAVETQLRSLRLGPVQNMSDVKSQPKTTYENFHPPQELFPVWVGNLVYSASETTITDLFSKVGVVHSVKMLNYKRCAFVNFTKQEHCEEAIRRFHGCALNGMKIAVRYPDRIPPGMGISRSALTSDDLQDEQNDYFGGRNAAGGRRPAYPYRQFSNYRDDH